MSWIDEDGNEVSWTDHMVRDDYEIHVTPPSPPRKYTDEEMEEEYDQDFSWALDTPVDFDEDFIAHLNARERMHVHRIQVAKENGAATEINPAGAGRLFFWALFGPPAPFRLTFGEQTRYNMHRESGVTTIEYHKEGSMDPMNANMLPEITDADVEGSFATLLETNDEVTTLDVKNDLRAKGFWANQNDVSRAIWKFVQATAPKYSYDYSAGHRVYSVTPADQLIAAPGTVPVPVSKKPADIGDWEVFNRNGANGANPSKTYLGVTRNKARYDFAKEFGISYINAVARKA